MLEIKNVTKAYGGDELLRDVSFSLEGGVLGVVSSGASGSTLLNIIGGLVAPDSGSVEIDSYDISKYPFEARRATGYIPSSVPPSRSMTAYEFLLFIGESKKIPAEKLSKQIGEALDLFEIDTLKDVLLMNISASERRLLGVAATLLGNPDVILIDEPLEGLTLGDRATLSSVIKMLGRMKSVIIACDDEATAARLSDKVIVIEEGYARSLEISTETSEPEENEKKEDSAE